MEAAVFLYFVLVWLVPAIIGNRMGAARGQPVVGLFLGLLFSWLGVLACAFLPNAKAQELQAQAVKVMPAHPGSAHAPGYAGPASNTTQADAADYKDCPMCAEKVRVNAIKCRHCQADLSQVA